MEIERLRPIHVIATALAVESGFETGGLAAVPFRRHAAAVWRSHLDWKGAPPSPMELGLATAMRVARVIQETAHDAALRQGRWDLAEEISRGPVAPADD